MDNEKVSRAAGTIGAAIVGASRLLHPEFGMTLAASCALAGAGCTVVSAHCGNRDVKRITGVMGDVCHMAVEGYHQHHQHHSP